MSTRQAVVGWEQGTEKGKESQGMVATYLVSILVHFFGPSLRGTTGILGQDGSKNCFIAA